MLCNLLLLCLCLQAESLEVKLGSLPTEVDRRSSSHRGLNEEEKKDIAAEVHKLEGKGLSPAKAEKKAVKVERKKEKKQEARLQKKGAKKEKKEAEEPIDKNEVKAKKVHKQLASMEQVL